MNVTAEEALKALKGIEEPAKPTTNSLMEKTLASVIGGMVSELCQAHILYSSDAVRFATSKTFEDCVAELEVKAAEALKLITAEEVQVKFITHSWSLNICEIIIGERKYSAKFGLKPYWTEDNENKLLSVGIGEID